MALTVESFTPITGHMGDRVTITGTGFISTPTVTFGFVTAYVISYTETTISARVPENAVTGTIDVTIGIETIPSSTSFVVIPYGPHGPAKGDINKIKDMDIIYVKRVSGNRGSKIMGVDWADDAFFAIPDDENTKSNLHFNGEEGLTTFTDEYGKIWSPSGMAFTSTDNPKWGIGYGSMALGGYIHTPSVEDFNIENGNVSIEVWVKNLVPGDTVFSCMGSGFSGYSGYSGYTVPGYYSLTYPTSTTLRFKANVNGSSWYFDGTVPESVATDFETKEIWHHIAFVKNANTYIIYLGGNNIGSDTNDDGIVSIDSLGLLKIGG